MGRQNYAVAGEVDSFVRFTAELLFKPIGEDGYMNLGNVEANKVQVDVEKKEVKASLRFGRRKVARRDITGITPSYGVTLNEETRETMLFKLFAEAGSDRVQGSGTDATAAFTNVQQRRSYDLGKRLVSNVVVEVAAVAKTVDVDYKVDAEVGMVSIIDGGGIANDDDVDVTFDHAAVTDKTFSAFTTSKRIGTVRLIESSSESEADVERIHEGEAEVWAEAKNDRGAEDFEKYDLMIYPRGDWNVYDPTA